MSGAGCLGEGGPKHHTLWRLDLEGGLCVLHNLLVPVVHFFLGSLIAPTEN